jgi:hypothetical protein
VHLPVVVGLPLVQELLDSLQRHTLGLIGDSLLLRQACLCQAPAQVGERRRRHVDAEGRMESRAGVTVPGVSVVMVLP